MATKYRVKWRAQVMRDLGVSRMTITMWLRRSDWPWPKSNPPSAEAVYTWRLATFAKLDKAQRNLLRSLISTDGVEKSSQEAAAALRRKPRTIEEAATQLKIEQVQMATLKRKQLDGSLVSSDIVEQAIADCCTVLREELLRLLDIAPTRLGLDPSGEHTLRELIEEMLARIRERGQLEQMKASDPTHGRTTANRSPGRPRASRI